MLDRLKNVLFSTSTPKRVVAATIGAAILAGGVYELVACSGVLGSNGPQHCAIAKTVNAILSQVEEAKE